MTSLQIYVDVQLRQTNLKLKTIINYEKFI